MGVFHFRAYASGGINDEAASDFLVVSTTWLDTDMLRIDVLNKNTDAQTSLAIRVSEYLIEGESSPYITIQAVDLDGNSSGAIRVQNPFYAPGAATGSDCLDNGNSDSGVSSNNNNINSNSSNNSSINSTGNDNGDGSSTGVGSSEIPVDINSGNADDFDNTDIAQPEYLRPLTPDGTGTVIDNVMDTNGIEFFTIFTEDGNEFFLIVDRQRSEDNVYLLNTVTEEDLISLAEAGGREVAPSGLGFGDGVPAPVHPNAPSDISDDGYNDEDIEGEEPNDNQQTGASSGNSNLIIIIIAAILAGGAGYYFKIYKKRSGGPVMGSYDEDEDDSFDDDDWNYDDGDDYDNSYEAKGGGDFDDED